MSENTETSSVLKADKTSWEDTLDAAICSAISKNSKRIYPACDIFSKEIKAKHGEEDFYRAIFSSMFCPRLSAKAATELLSRRKCSYEPGRNLDLSKFGDLISLSLQLLSRDISINPENLFKPVFIEHLPEMLAAINPEERDLVYRRAAMLTYGREARNNKKIKQTEVVPTQESPNNEIVEVIEPEVSPIVTQNEPVPKLEFVPEPVTVNDPEKPSEVRLNLKYSDVNTSVPPESIPTPKKVDFSVYRNQE